jgi:hypothetical protein
MNLSSRIEAFEKLGFVLKSSLNDIANQRYNESDSYGVNIEQTITQSTFENGWFIPQFIHFSLNEVAGFLNREVLLNWLSVYHLEKLNKPSNQITAIVMAGNLPLVGFHDFLSVLISGFKVQVKLSQKDSVLPRMIIDLLIAIEPRFRAKITIANDRLSAFDAVIATGSNNTLRYFEYYFKSCPSIIRGHKNSCAVLKGNETEKELDGLMDDLFLYFGMGCRSVSKLYIPQQYSLEMLFPYFEKYNQVLYNHHKYMNNYLYHKSIMLVNQTPFLENGYVMMTENEVIASPISVINYQRYHNIKEVVNELKTKTEQIQCVVSSSDLATDVVEFGASQKPQLIDYADGVDVIDFLLSIKK